MASYIRLRREGGLYFFTLVTHHRRPFLVADRARACLRRAWEKTRNQYSFDLVAVCVLPDHMHCIWHLPEKDADFPIRWQLLKSGFTRAWRRTRGTEGQRTARQQRKGERAVFQPRYYEHCIRDHDDFNRHFDYIHYNPVKHGIATSVSAWFHRYVRLGWYPPDWGISPTPRIWIWNEYSRKNTRIPVGRVERSQTNKMTVANPTQMNPNVVRFRLRQAQPAFPRFIHFPTHRKAGSAWLFHVPRFIRDAVAGFVLRVHDVWFRSTRPTVYPLVYRKMRIARD